MRNMLQDLVDIRWRQGAGSRQVGLVVLNVFATQVRDDEGFRATRRSRAREPHPHPTSGAANAATTICAPLGGKSRARRPRSETL